MEHFPTAPLPENAIANILTKSVSLLQDSPREEPESSAYFAWQSLLNISLQRFALTILGIDAN